MGTLDDLLDAAAPGWRDRPTARQAVWRRDREAALRLCAALNTAAARMAVLDGCLLLCAGGWTLRHDDGRWAVADEPPAPR